MTMTEKPTEQTAPETPAEPNAGAQNTPAGQGEAQKPKEIGGRKGPEPTRYGDWEKGGICSDF